MFLFFPDDTLSQYFHFIWKTRRMNVECCFFPRVQFGGVDMMTCGEMSFGMMFTTCNVSHSLNAETRVLKSMWSNLYSSKHCTQVLEWPSEYRTWIPGIENVWVTFGKNIGQSFKLWFRWNRRCDCHKKKFWISFEHARKNTDWCSISKG